MKTRRIGQIAAGLSLLSLLGSCRARPREQVVKPTLAASALSAPARTASAKAGPIRMETLDSTQSPPVFVMRGAPRGPERLVFLHGLCGHGLGYAQSFQFHAAQKGTLIAPQADISCGGAFSKWSNDVVALDARIVRTFEALGEPDPNGEIAIIGMSQGATRAIALVKRFPRRYTRLISMDAPTALKVGEARSLRAGVMMAGERDRKDLMRRSQRALSASGVPATFIIIPEAEHGAMGPTPEQTMGQALDWLWTH